jgi:hypothetical protein
MAGEIYSDIPPDMGKVYGRLQGWRSRQTRRAPIPESLWTAAAKLAREHGINATAKALHLEYGKLKQRAAAVGVTKGRGAKATMPAAVARRARSVAPTRFVELMAPGPGSSPECRIELEGPRGRMRIEFKGIATAELVALGRMLWDSES